MKKTFSKAKAKKCKISDWTCLYHACMTNDCQKKHVLKHENWGKGNCEKS